MPLLLAGVSYLIVRLLVGPLLALPNIIVLGLLGLILLNSTVMGAYHLIRFITKRPAEEDKP